MCDVVYNERGMYPVPIVPRDYVLLFLFEMGSGCVGNIPIRVTRYLRATPTDASTQREATETVRATAPLRGGGAAQELGARSGDSAKL